MRHHAARAQAILLATGRLETLCNKARAGSKDAPKKLRRARAMGQLLCSPAIQLPLLVNDLLHLPAGYQQGCLVLQQTCAVFFPLHLCAAQMWWQLIFLGCPQWERQQLIDRTVRARQASLQPSTTFRCRFCGLLQQNAKMMVDHFRSCHPDSCWIYARQPENYEPQRLRRTSVVTPPLVTRWQVGTDPFAGLALRQRGSMVMPLEAAGAYAAVYANLVAHVEEWGEATSTSKLTWKTWVAFTRATLPARLWRLCPNFWKAHVEAVLCGTYKQVPLSRSAAKTAPSSSGLQASKQPATSSTGTRFQPSKLELAERIGFADHVCVVLKAGQSFIRDLGRAHEEHVIFSHGDHVPMEVRNAAVVAFWLPDFLGIEYQSMRRADALEFWSSRVSEFCVVAEYVAKRLAAYSWPPEFELRSQYRDLMMHWGKLCTSADVKNMSWPSLSTSRQRHLGCSRSSPPQVVNRHYCS